MREQWSEEFLVCVYVCVEYPSVSRDNNATCWP